MKITIIGAGIGGLTTALTLQQKGFLPGIYEAASRLKTAGAGIILASNAMQIYNKLGIAAQIADTGNRISCMKITDHRLRDISTINLLPYEKKYGVSNIAIHRGELQKILIEKVQPGYIRTGKRLDSVVENTSVMLHFEDGSADQSDLVIGADGIRSVVRNQCFEKSTLRDARQLCWRGISPMDISHKYRHALIEAWGKGKRIGFVQLAPQKTYWYALADIDLIDTREESNLTELFSNFHTDLLEIITKTPTDQYIINHIQDLNPIRHWFKNNICLLGDAAHATTPNMGQGACQAIEDAWVLGQCIGQNLNVKDTLAMYEKRRMRKALNVVNTSWQIGKLAHLRSDTGSWLRNLIMRSMPSYLSRKQTDMLYQLV